MQTRLRLLALRSKLRVCAFNIFSNAQKPPFPRHITLEAKVITREHLDGGVDPWVVTKNLQ